jgi:hypothetical protein
VKNDYGSQGPEWAGRDIEKKKLFNCGTVEPRHSISVQRCIAKAEYPTAVISLVPHTHENNKKT